MKATKFIVLVGGFLGLISFFMPLVSVHKNGKTVTVSCFQAVKGLDSLTKDAEDNIDKSGADVEVRAAATAHLRESKSEVDSKVGLFMLIAYGPSVLLLLIGGVAVARKRFGRLGGTGALLIGLIGLGIGALMVSISEGATGSGIYMLVLAGIAGTVGGLMTLVKPDRGLATA